MLRFPATTCETWYKIIGELNDGIPLIALHGGPGAAHEYLLPLIGLHGKCNLTIVFYDQVGCGNSTRLREKAGDETFWTVDLFIHELENLTGFLGIREHGFRILGQSCGILRNATVTMISTATSLQAGPVAYGCVDGVASLGGRFYGLANHVSPRPNRDGHEYSRQS
ncbi:hypothetical protein CC80DRAFT_508264 [Byssothecium circinans]|uniref:AB hydrolase-1 domain-containing protein n=1 Tax=Byssothecium circinans TaxID=147558 RepID=A0A6A5TH93_9PLEO|nr:hypothetical protein CC80DRAFT_508264 [Byssothecium circinans]